MSTTPEMKKPQLLLLHGALGSSASYNTLIELLSQNIDTKAMDFPGHGGLSLQYFSTNLFVQAVNDFIESNFSISKPVFVFGYSMGGYIALLASLRGNKNISGIITLATKMDWSHEIANAENQMLNPEALLEKAPAFVNKLEILHAPTHWKTLLYQTSVFLNELGDTNPLAPEHLSALNCPCLFLLGDRDKMVSLKETVNAFQSISGAALGVLPFTGHPFEKANPVRLAFEIEQFIKSFSIA